MPTGKSAFGGKPDADQVRASPDWKRRLRIGGRLVDDNSAKIGCATFFDAQLLYAYTGLSGAGLIPEPDEYRGFLDGLSLRHDCVCRKGFIRPAQRDAFHDDLIVGYSRVLAHHG